MPSSLSFVSSRRASLRLEQPAAPAPQDERMLNERAVSVIRRIKSKLAGNDFKEEEAGGPLDVPTQVNRLISEAQANYNLCQLYIGWCPVRRAPLPARPATPRLSACERRGAVLVRRTCR